MRYHRRAALIRSEAAEMRSCASIEQVPDLSQNLLRKGYAERPIFSLGRYVVRPDPQPGAPYRGFVIVFGAESSVGVGRPAGLSHLGSGWSDPGVPDQGD